MKLSILHNINYSFIYIFIPKRFILGYATFKSSFLLYSEVDLTLVIFEYGYTLMEPTVKHSFIPQKIKKMRIFWTEKAVSQHKELEKYLLQNWTQKELKNYTEKLSKIIELLSKFPETGVLINGLYRKMNVTKHTALIYRIVNGELVVVLMVWDNRSKPIW